LRRFILARWPSEFWEIEIALRMALMLEYALCEVQ
jgi:hypothetical protein